MIRSGGLGGLRLRSSVDLSQLSDQERAALEECFRRPPGPPAGPDRFQYRLRQGEREAIVQEHELPEQLRPLIERLSRSASPEG